MSYATGEAAALALIQTLPDFDATNSVSLANDNNNKGATLLSSGKSDCYVILRPGAFVSDYLDIAGSLTQHRWQTSIDLYVLKTGVDAPEYRLASLRQSIIDTLDAHFRLNESVGYAKVISGESIATGATGGTNSAPNGTPYIRQEMILVWEEERSLTQNDND